MRSRARAWLRRNFGSICAAGGGAAQGRRAEAKLGHEQARISARWEQPRALTRRVTTWRGVAQGAAPRGRRAGWRERRRGVGRRRRQSTHPLGRRVLVRLRLLDACKRWRAAGRQASGACDGAAAAGGRDRRAQALPSVRRGRTVLVRLVRLVVRRVVLRLGHRGDCGTRAAAEARRQEGDRFRGGRHIGLEASRPKPWHTWPSLARRLALSRDSSMTARQLRAMPSVWRC